MTDLEGLQAYHAGESRMNIDLTCCPTCGRKWHNCTCPPLLETIRDLERAEYERRIAALEAQVQQLRHALWALQDWKRQQEGGK